MAKPETGISPEVVTIAIEALKRSGRPTNAAAFYDAAKVVDAAKPFTDQNLSAGVLRQIGGAWARGQLDALEKAS